MHSNGIFGVRSAEARRAASDFGMQNKCQGESGTASPERKAPDDPSRAPESGDKPEADGQG
jgi:hypothetical protein